MSNRRPEQDWAGGEGNGETSLVEQIKLLSDALAGTNVTELELEEGGLRIRLQRQPIPMQPVAFAAMPAPPASARPEEAAEMTLAVMAPLTGVFYSSPSPDTPPFVVPGDKVQPGQVVCMVEAMKVFNEIKTEIGGVVTAIPPKSGQLVKKGDPLVRIKPY
ncbi:MAG: acetyl-CoA carboxylase biotin carboxyl carrier protein [Ktedonobacterales bacterium]|nr:acetyl-CoA carboxylase biotin carboxyl carrier protein [Ktedonobacterales bacterium]